MKKYVLAIVLLVVLLVISYVKIVRQATKEEEAYNSGVRASQNELVRSSNKIDSLIESAGNREVAFADSITATHRMYQSKLDSINNALVAKETTIVKLKGDLKKVRKGKGNSKPSQASKKKSSLHQRILASYQKRYEALPLDLSEYERKVALAEIRQETAKSFNISLSELRRIREANKLKY